MLPTSQDRFLAMVNPPLRFASPTVAFVLACRHGAQPAISCLKFSGTRKATHREAPSVPISHWVVSQSITRRYRNQWATCGGARIEHRISGSAHVPAGVALLASVRDLHKPPCCLEYCRKQDHIPRPGERLVTREFVVFIGPYGIASDQLEHTREAFGGICWNSATCSTSCEFSTFKAPRTGGAVLALAQLPFPDLAVLRMADAPDQHESQSSKNGG